MDGWLEEWLEGWLTRWLAKYLAGCLNALASLGLFCPGPSSPAALIGPGKWQATTYTSLMLHATHQFHQSPCDSLRPPTACHAHVGRGRAYPCLKLLQGVNAWHSQGRHFLPRPGSLSNPLLAHSGTACLILCIEINYQHDTNRGN